MNSGKEYGDWTDAAGNENPTFADGDYELTLYYKERDTENPVDGAACPRGYAHNNEYKWRRMDMHGSDA